MSFVDIDEADLAVLNQNLLKSKEIFDAISKSLNTISTKSRTASNTIKPVLKDVNTLIESKSTLEKNLNTLSEVSLSAEKIHGYEKILNDDINTIGLVKYVNTLELAKQLHLQIKTNFKRFKGITMSLASLIDNSEKKMHRYLQSFINQDPNMLIERKSQIQFIFNHFQNDEEVLNTYSRSRAELMVKKLSPITQSCLTISSPFEKGQHGINKYTETILDLLSQEFTVIKQCQIPNLLPLIIEQVVNNYISTVIHKLNLPETEILLILEILNNLTILEYILKTKYKYHSENLKSTINNFTNAHRSLFLNVAKSIDSKFHSNNITEQRSQEIITDCMNRLRKISEFKKSLLGLISNLKPGVWIPGDVFKFVEHYSSVVPLTDQDKETLLSCFYSDMIDCIMVNIEMDLKKTEMKKTIQGFILIKDLFMVETIINRSQDLFLSLGPKGQERMGKLKNRYLKIFLEDFSHSSYIIIRDMTSIATSQATSTSGVASNLSSKEKENVKELFANFNKSFEDALSNYQKLSFGDNLLKNYLTNEIKKMIIPSYNKLYDKYGNSDFTKNKSKYVKYDKVQFESVLNNL